MTKLFLVPTPIGNLEDISIRAINVLKEVDTILCEDTRTSKKLLNRYEIHKPLESFHQHNEHTKTASIVERLLNGEVIALITDAGTPGISDPGFLLARQCIQTGIKIEYDTERFKYQVTKSFTATRLSEKITDFDSWQITIDDIEAGTYTISARVRSKSGGTLSLYMGGEKITTFNFTDSDNVWRNVVVENVTVPAKNPLRVTFEKDAFDIDFLQFTNNKYDEKYNTYSFQLASSCLKLLHGGM